MTGRRAEYQPSRLFKLAFCLKVFHLLRILEKRHPGGGGKTISGANDHWWYICRNSLLTATLAGSLGSSAHYASGLSALSLDTIRLFSTRGRRRAKAGACWRWRFTRCRFRVRSNARILQEEKRRGRHALPCTSAPWRLR